MRFTYRFPNFSGFGTNDVFLYVNELYRKCCDRGYSVPQHQAEHLYDPVKHVMCRVQHLILEFLLTIWQHLFLSIYILSLFFRMGTPPQYPRLHDHVHLFTFIQFVFLPSVRSKKPNKTVHALLGTKRRCITGHGKQK